MILVDSNLVIYAASGRYPELGRWFAGNDLAASALTLVEVLGYHKLSDADKAILGHLFDDLTIIYPDSAIFQRAVVLRQQQAMSVGDALIAATALLHRLPLATHNSRDFARVSGLNLQDPMQDRASGAGETS